MRKLFLALLLVVASCTQAQVDTILSSPAGHFFCAVQLAGGGSIVVAMVNAKAGALEPGAAPITGVTTTVAKNIVDANCAQVLPAVPGATTAIATNAPANLTGVTQVVVPKVIVVAPGSVDTNVMPVVK